MKTEEWVSFLARGVEPVRPHAIGRRYATALALGSLAATLLMIALLGLRADLAVAASEPMFWVKLAFPGTLAGVSLFIVWRLGTPGVGLGWLPLGLALPVLVIWGLGVYGLITAPVAERADLLFGETWARCPWLIAALSIPGFFAAIWAMRDLAPTRARLSGAASGLLAGALGAAVYSLHCPEMGAPFLGIWYLLGMLIPALAGSLLGPRLLSW